MTNDQTKALNSIRNGLHVSYSQINTYLLCPLKYRFAYVEGREPERVSAALPFGASLHRALALFFREITTKQAKPPLEAIQEAFRALWNAAVNEGTTLVFKEKETADGLKDMGAKMLGVVYNAVNPDIEVLAVEEPLHAELTTESGNVLEPRLVGVVDLILREPDGSYTVVDHKTAARRYSDNRVENDLQMAAYGYVIERGGFLPEGARVGYRYDVLLKTKQPERVEYPAILDGSDIRRFGKVARTVLAGINADVFYPNPGWTCGDCGFLGACRNW
jgi:putative RecB family exonuclease